MPSSSDAACEQKLMTAVKALVAALKSQDGAIRITARRALQAIGEPAVPPLIAALTSTNNDVRWEAAKALGYLRAPQAAEALVAALRDGDTGVRWLAAEALGGLGRAGLEPLLTALVHQSDSPLLRSGAHHVLRSLADTVADVPVRPVIAALESGVQHAELVVRAHEALQALREASGKPPA
jgi:HEAT repeat protein